MSEIWVLSMCDISEGGGDVRPAELYATEDAANAAVIEHAKNEQYWGCVDYVVAVMRDPHNHSEED